ncbi:MAG: hypothetical protein EBR82_12275 [Caulobacteraceae bacterium]|nr:hypothetical protein [Caulobacteraceae bacterium]
MSIRPSLSHNSELAKLRGRAVAYVCRTHPVRCPADAAGCWRFRVYVDSLRINSDGAYELDNVEVGA